MSNEELENKLKKVMHSIMIDPILGILNFNWGILELNAKIDDPKVKIIYLIRLNGYYRRKADGKIFAKALKTKVIEDIKAIFNTKDSFIFDYEEDKIAIVSDVDMSEKLVESKLDISIGYTDKKDGDTPTSFLIRAVSALKDAKAINKTINKL